VGGQDGSRGYLVQSIVALLESLNDETWEQVSIEPDVASQKVDILWEGRCGDRAVQVKSSINQIGKADVERWASELKSGASADHHALILVGPCSQSVVEMQSFDGVAIPRPKNADITGLLSEAAHLLDKFLESQWSGRTSASQRELMVLALTTHLSECSTTGKAISRADFVALLKEWISGIKGQARSAWEQVSFAQQRGIENAVAGKRLGPSDVRACPEFSICHEIVDELKRSHLHELVGTPGCGKSITAWHVAKRFHDAGFSVWRPNALAKADDLLGDVPNSPPMIIVIDDAHRLGKPFANRMSELSNPDRKVLLVSTVQEPLLSHVICLSPEPCVNQLTKTLLHRRDELLPIVQQFDSRVGNRYHEISYESRLSQAKQERKPEEFFWVLRGGWQTAKREFESVKQFDGATDLLLLIALSQIASCDAGVPLEWIGHQAEKLGVAGSALERALEHLDRLGLVLLSESVRTKHINYAYRIVEESFRSSNFDAWPRMSGLFVECLLASGWSLRGIAWALDSICHADAFVWGRNQSFHAVIQPVTERSTQEREDIDWAAGCLSRLFMIFRASTEEILKHRAVILEWATSRPGLVSYFCNDIINHLINESNNAKDNIARDFINCFDAAKLANAANTVGVEELHSFGKLLDRLAYYGPSWAGQFFDRFDWERAKALILNAEADRAFSVDAFVAGLSLLGRKDDTLSLRYIEEIVPYISRAINAAPTDTVEDMHGVLWTCLGYSPRPFHRCWLLDEHQTRIAKQIVAQVDPQQFAMAMERAIPRDLEKLARSFQIIQEIDPNFIKRVAGCLSDTDFFAATVDGWKEQSGELQVLTSFFSLGEDFEPVASWVRKNKQIITGPLCTLFACVAPDVAIEFHKNGKGIEIVNPRHPIWQHTTIVFKRMAALDKSLCAKIVAGQLEKLRDAIYTFGPGSVGQMLRFWRTLYEVFPELFERLTGDLNLDDQAAKNTIEEVRSHPKERFQYTKLARCGQRLTGRFAQLCSELLCRLKMT
jgi:hypothetical protein